MKYIVIIGDGMADRPIQGLGGRTPLQVSKTPNMDRLASEGVVGSVKTIPDGLQPGSDVANLSILGYNPVEYYAGRAPLEAASMGVTLEDEDVAYRCNLVTLRFSKGNSNALMEDYSAGHISTQEARELINQLQNEIGSHEHRFYPGVSYRHLMVWRGGKVNIECVPPHDITGKQIGDYLPVGDGAEVLQGLMRRSVDVLSNHRINLQRVAEGKKEANSIWLWGQGKRPQMPSFKERYGLSGALISAVDLTKGLGVYAGFKIIDVPGATGWIDTNYSGKADFGLRALEEVDFLYLHVEAPDEAGHSGNIQYKIQAIEDLDAKVVGPVFEGLKRRFGDFRLLVMPDHPTPIEIKTHSDEPVPFVIYDSRGTKGAIERPYDEQLHSAPDAVQIKEGYRLMDFFLKGKIN